MKCLVIDRPYMGIGGIENIQIQLLKYCIDQGYRVIWLTTEEHEKSSAYKNITDAPEVEKYYLKRTPFGPIYPSLKFADDEDAVVLTTDLLRYCISQHVMKGWQCHTVSHLLTIPHFKGGAVLPETCLRSGRTRERWRLRLSNAAEWIDRTGNLIGFSDIHLTAYEKEYGLSVANKDSKVLKAIFPLDAPADEIIEKKAKSRRDEFNIITCARFDFPHKGYMLGLIKAFSDIYERHPEARLFIVGYGQGEKQVKDALSRLPEAARSQVVLTGPLSPEQLKTKMLSCHLNIGVAGSLWRGAECALPSICMRHYTYECEGYGFIDDVGDIMSDSAGFNVVPLIENVIKMDDSAYIEKSIKSFNAAQSQIDVDPEFVFKLPATNLDTFPLSELEARGMFFLRLFLERICKRSMYEDQLNASK